MDRRKFQATLRRQTARFADKIPLATAAWLVLIRHSSRLMKDSKFILEGFPRSANTLATFRIAVANPDLPFAHHTHKPSQLIRAAKRGIPALILYRHPADAISSLLKVDPSAYTAIECVRDYLYFYRTALALPKGSVYFVPYETVTTSEGTDFARILEVVTGIRRVASPDEVRGSLGVHLEEMGYEDYTARFGRSTTSIGSSTPPTVAGLQLADEIWEPALRIYCELRQRAETQLA